MSVSTIPSFDSFERRQADVLDSSMTYIDVGEGDPVVFLHGNGTFSYLWRNIIPYVQKSRRCLAPDLIGMGDSGPNPSGSYRFVDHYKYIDAWFEALNLDRNVILVLHDWGGALGFNWAYHHQQSIQGIVYMETFVCPLSWDDFPKVNWRIFKSFRSPEGEEEILQNNYFVATQLPARILRDLTQEERAAYLHPYLEPGESRRPTLTWTREVPLDGEPADVTEIVDRYGQWLAASRIPKLFINADPGSILVSRQREFCRGWANQEEITVKGIHFIQEDSPDEIGRGLAGFARKCDA